MQTNLGPVCALYPMPTTLVGAQVDGRPNFMTVAHVGILNNAPPQYLTVSLKKFRHTARGIHQTGTFSICLPSRSQVVPADYCGIVSGARTDKSRLFEVFYGALETAPMIMDCPINMEFRLHQVLDLPAHEVFVGELVATHADPAVLDKGKIELERVKPLLFDYASGWYYALGEPVAPCWQAGRDQPVPSNEEQGA
jgi:flavin reductase (DIM6/NTAB) family NADH-FMN oxidoreductase RutF